VSRKKVNVSVKPQTNDDPIFCTSGVTMLSQRDPDAKNQSGMPTPKKKLINK